MPRAAHAARIAETSAWAVGSLSAVTRLTAVNSRPSAVTTTAPNGPPSSEALRTATSIALRRWRCTEASAGAEVVWVGGVMVLPVMGLRLRW